MEMHKPPMVSLDLRKCRIRIHKSTLHAIGKPDYIQILINPTTMELAIHKSLSEDYLAHKVMYINVKSHCYELYSRTLIRSIQEVCPSLQADRAYTISGTTVQNGNLVKFSLNDAEILPRKDERDHE